MLLLKLVVGVVALFSVATASKLETIDNASVLPAVSEDVTPYYPPNHAPAYDEWPEDEVEEEEEEDDVEANEPYDYYYEERPSPGGYRTDPDEWDSEEYSDYPDYEVSEEQGEGHERQKRKVIYGRGGYGRRGSRGGSPYGRRRNNQNYHGPDYGPEGPSSRNHGTRSSPMAAPTTPRVRLMPTTAKPASMPKPTAHPATTKSKMGRRETKKKLSKDVKTQIAEYAIANGNARAADHFRDIIGKKLSEKTIDKFVKRHQRKQKKLQKNNN